MSVSSYVSSYANANVPSPIIGGVSDQLIVAPYAQRRAGQPIGPPTNFSAMAGGTGTAVLQWTLVPGATSYSVYSKVGKNYILLQSGLTNNVGTTISGLSSGTPYALYLTAVNSAGQSTYSNVADVTPN
jgi:Fibronectin type III domain